MALDDEKLAVELDSRDQLAKFRSQFHVPTVGELTGRTNKSGPSTVLSEAGEYWGGGGRDYE